MNPNLAAFLTMLSVSEGTSKGADPYRVCYAFIHTIVSFADHPAATGEWSGETITVGKYAGEKSTAAGRYQINLPTWRMCKRALNLQDFSPSSQDRAATWLIQQDGALDLILGGDVQGAISICKETWASLPGNSAGQPQAKLADLLRTYGSAGGSEQEAQLA